MQTATPDQIGRILGDWLRMQGNSLRRQNPEVSQGFLNSAGLMLWRAYRDDNALPSGQSPQGNISASLIPDPKLLAVYGLYERVSCNEGKALEFLEADVQAGVVRPKAYEALAEMRYAAALAHPLGAAGTISRPQTAAILDPLKKILRYPPTLASRNLVVDTWGHSEAQASAEDIETIVQGALLFPRATDLAYKSALVCARNGYPAQAALLIDQGLVFATDKVQKKHFERLRSMPAAPRAPGLN